MDVIIGIVGFLGLVGVFFGGYLYVKKSRELGLAVFATALALLVGDLLTLTSYRLGQQQLKNAENVQKIAMIEAIRAGFAQADEETRISTIELMVGPRKIAEQIVAAVLNSEVYYKNYNVDVKFSYLDPKEGSEADRKELFKFEASYDILIINHTEREISYPLRARFYDLAGPQEGSYMDNVSFTLVDQDGQPLKGSAPMVWDKERLLNKAPFNAKGRDIVMEETIPLKAKQTARLTLVMKGYDRQRGGQYSLQTRYIAIDMKMRATFPDKTFQPVMVYAHGQQADPRVCVTKRINDKSIEGEILAGLLPYQGIVCTWSKQP